MKLSKIILAVLLFGGVLPSSTIKAQTTSIVKRTAMSAKLEHKVTQEQVQVDVNLNGSISITGNNTAVLDGFKEFVLSNGSQKTVYGLKDTKRVKNYLLF